MNINDYIKTAVSSVSSRRDRKAIEAELREHYEDRYNYYIDSGYEQPQAEQMALERMGSAEAVAADMAKLYNGYANTIANIAAVSVIGLRALISFLAMLGIESRFSHVSLHLEFALIITLCVMVLVAIKMQNRFLSYFAFGCYLLVPIYNIYLSMGSDYAGTKYVSGIVVSFVYFFTGKIDNFGFISGRLADVKVADWAVVLSVICYIAVAVIMLAAIILLDKKKKTKKNNKQLTAFRVVLLCLLLGISVMRVILQYEFVYYSWETGNDCITIIEADEPYDITEQQLEPGSYESYEVSYDWSAYLWLVDETATEEFTEERFDSIIIYKVNNNYLEYKPGKEYVYVLSSPGESVTDGVTRVAYSPDNWVKTNREYHYDFPIEYNDYPININHITILPK